MTIEEDYENVVAALQAVVRLCETSCLKGNMTVEEYADIAKCMKALYTLLKEKT